MYNVESEVGTRSGVEWSGVECSGVWNVDSGDAERMEWRGRMEKGVWRVESGEWTVDSGRYREWKVGSRDLESRERSALDMCSACRVVCDTSNQGESGVRCRASAFGFVDYYEVGLHSV